MTKRSFAVAVVDHYHSAVPAEIRTVRFISAGDPFDAAKTNAKHIFRFGDELVQARLPADLEESLVQSLPDPHRTDCLRDLCARYNLLPVELPSAEPGQNVRFLGDVASKAGDVLRAASPIIDDGVIDDRDVDFIPAALDSLNALQATIAGLSCRLLAVLNPKGGG